MNSVSSISRLTRITLAVAVLSAVAACGKKPDAQGAPPPAGVSIVTIAPERLALTTELPGRLEATRIAQIGARAAGIVLKRTFREGSDVKAGQTLYLIDPAPLRATYDSAQAALAKAEANLTTATLKAQRYKPLVEVNAVSKQDYDDTVAAQKQAAADVASAKAARETASLNLGYATVTSPISGRIGKALVTEGALVGQGEVTQLATVQQIDPIYVNLTQSSTDILKLQEAMRNGQLQSAGQGQAKVTLETEDGHAYPQSGKLLFSDLTVDPNTGSVTLRAEFPNPDHSLLPGMYVRAKLEQAVNADALTVPQQAVQRDLNGASVFLVGADNKVSVQPVKADTAQGDKWIVTEGLKAGDKVIVDGLQKVKPGAVVNPAPWKPAAAPAAATAAAPAAPQADSTSKAK
ncbi:efflux RND transporter periplasmic adaptor subunit [Collimonas sp.]|jgi:membrane fusion protein (multidrug efflux system)|uniref:efflux RND transporter periplasmic adaptor subunit n=1 Tax=Collimonas sp. TaxID=1963772 RepID=UPI002CA34FB0|nr:efflux RND transporter periplasmic adaptor subunit [Collimonas sp.]HWX00115.1 efflux RND transporter periplasmic adaptor subunit [Collimonas sp.]